jgi:hypothetical protein
MSEIGSSLLALGAYGDEGSSSEEEKEGKEMPEKSGNGRIIRDKEEEKQQTRAQQTEEPGEKGEPGETEKTEEETPVLVSEEVNGEENIGHVEKSSELVALEESVGRNVRRGFELKGRGVSVLDEIKKRKDLRNPKLMENVSRMHYPSTHPPLFTRSPLLSHVASLSMLDLVLIERKGLLGIDDWGTNLPRESVERAEWTAEDHYASLCMCASHK